MRISIDNTDITDRAYGNWFARRFNKIAVFLDDSAIPYCTMADEELGEAHGYAVNTDGGLMTDADGCPVVNWYRGVVRIKIE